MKEGGGGKYSKYSILWLSHLPYCPSLSHRLGSLPRPWAETRLFGAPPPSSFCQFYKEVLKLRKIPTFWWKWNCEVKSLTWAGSKIPSLGNFLTLIKQLKYDEQCFFLICFLLLETHARHQRQGNAHFENKDDPNILHSIQLNFHNAEL